MIIIYSFIGPITDDQVDIPGSLEKVISHYIYDRLQVNKKFMFWTVLSAYKSKYYFIHMYCLDVHSKVSE